MSEAEEIEEAAGRVIDKLEIEIGQLQDRLVDLEGMEFRVEELEVAANGGPPIELGPPAPPRAKSKDEILDDHYQQIRDCRVKRNHGVGDRCSDCGWRRP